MMVGGVPQGGFATIFVMGSGGSGVLPCCCFTSFLSALFWGVDTRLVIPLLHGEVLIPPLCGEDFLFRFSFNLFAKAWFTLRFFMTSLSVTMPITAFLASISNSNFQCGCTSTLALGNGCPHAFLCDHCLAASTDCSNFLSVHNDC